MKHKIDVLDVAFASDDNYVKFMAVTIVSLVNSINNRFKINIHVITNNISNNNIDKLNKLCIELECVNYIKVYQINPDVFEDCPMYDWIKYSKLSIADVLPRDIKTCLLLDVDLVFLSSIDEIFSFNFPNDKILYAVLDYNKSDRKILSSKENSSFIKLNSKKYFNSGVMYIDLDKWRLNNIKNKCFDFLRNFKATPYYPEQDALNYVLCDYFLELPFNWNFLCHSIPLKEKIINYRLPFSCKDSGLKEYLLHCTLNEYEENYKNIKILHFAGGFVPWKNFFNKLDLNFNPICIYRKEWWSIADSIHIFRDDFEKLQFDNFEQDLFYLNNSIKNIICENVNYKKQVNNIKSTLSYNIGNIIVKSFKKWYRGDLFIMPFRILFFYVRYKVKK
ncbi:glycosyltransferase family 8 protein [Campylobacter jejuni]|uniref:Glycosyl transferase family 8 family n=1 Tax=Campylobacter jejuni subsp. jejuni TaxID=32022 RepID=A0A0S2CG31_CAMJU|nr:glycosyltransferase [Campylobacter jejuni]ALN44099.1 Glycosyl transferase family 8 family [Campylobacter jejuni subsp. jejuni]BEK28641.1 hypothetical protein B11353_15690 [Campylobacter jejuni]HDV6450044.1 hypothetical protein [Campylobacter jejuni]HEB8418227.1 hypothetical protein [Campylobacter jejuni]